MTEKKDDYSRLLEIFDDLELSDIHSRRLAYKPLYDFFNKLILEVGVGLCNLDENSLQTTHLQVRWKNIKYCLKFIEDPIIWDNTINTIHNIRSKVEHTDKSGPKKEQLLELRNKAPEFKIWIIKTAREYYKKSNNFTFMQGFNHLSNSFIGDAKVILHEYGEDPPYAATFDYSMEFKQYPYNKIIELNLIIEERLNKILKLEDFDRSDLENLIKLVEIISHFKGKEEVLLDNSICPKCGGKIETTNNYFGGSESDPEPNGVYWRIGCNKCDYIIEDDTEYF